MRTQRSIGIWAAVGGLSIVLGGVGWGQLGNRGGSGSMPTMPSNTPSLTPLGTPPDMPVNPAMVQEQAKMRNLDRQKQLVLDTQKLLALANQLKSDVDKSNKDTLSLDVIRKADEIEKLARSVKEKMKGG
jgi:hypothetical protein